MTPGTPEAQGILTSWTPKVHDAGTPEALGTLYTAKIKLGIQENCNLIGHESCYDSMVTYNVHVIIIQFQ